MFKRRYNGNTHQINFANHIIGPPSKKLYSVKKGLDIKILKYGNRTISFKKWASRSELMVGNCEWNPCQSSFGHKRTFAVPVNAPPREKNYEK